jgi:hypothetical protein
LAAITVVLPRKVPFRLQQSGEEAEGDLIGSGACETKITRKTQRGSTERL